MINGKIVALRAIEQSDLPQLLSWRNQPEYRRFFREYRELNSTNQTEWFKNKVINDSCTVMFAIVDLANDKLLGVCGLCYIDWINRNADFSIYIGKDGVYIDNSYATDAANVMIQYAFQELNLHRLWAEIYDFDEAKKVMFANLGFLFEGRHKQTHWTAGKWCDSLYYGLLRDEESSFEFTL